MRISKFPNYQPTLFKLAQWWLERKVQMKWITGKIIYFLLQQ